MQTELEVGIVRSDQDFAALQPEWTALWESSDAAVPFQRPEWLLPWWRQFHQRDLLVVTLRSNGRLVGLVPTYVYFDSTRDERQLLLVGAGTSDYLDGVFHESVRIDDAAAVVCALAREDVWDVAYFTQLREGSLLGKAMGTFAAAESFAGESCSQSRAYTVADLPKKLRADYRYFKNAAIGKGSLRLQVSTPDTAFTQLDELIHLHTARWNAAGQSGVLADRLVLAWHRESVPHMQAAGLLRIYSLLLDDQTIAALYAMIDPPGRTTRTVYHYLIGYAPEYASIKPGLLLSAMASDHAATEQVQVIDMLRGEEAYKHFWSTREVRTSGFRLRREDALQTWARLETAAAQ